RRRHPGKRRILNRGVAITAINPKARVMVLVTEWHLLPPRHIHFGHVRRPINRINRRPEKKKENHRASQRRSGQRVAVGTKDLGHRNSPLLTLAVEIHSLFKPISHSSQHGNKPPSASFVFFGFSGGNSPASFPFAHSE